jgi:broad specificity phosphatase PhoE
MSRLLLLRHAQASYLEPNYDKLSATGERQARVLGKYWTRHKINFDRVFSGPRVRQTDTARIVAAACREAGHTFPEPVVLQEFNEYDGEAILKHALPQLLESDAEIRALHQAYLDTSPPADRSKNFQKMVEAVIDMWVAGEIVVPGVESWPEFTARVNRGLSQIISGARRGECSVVFSSGGPIAIGMQRALNLSAQDTLRVAWMSRNCSYSEFLFSGERFTLSAFNAFPHLEDGTLLTYR